MKTNILGEKVEVKDTASFTGEVVAVSYHQYGYKSYHRGFDVLIKTEDGRLIKCESNQVTIKPE